MRKLKLKSKVKRQKWLKLFFEVPYLKLPVVFGEETIKALHKAGFRVVRQKGSHVRMEKRTEKGVVKVTVPLHPSLKKGLYGSY